MNRAWTFIIDQELNQKDLELILEKGKQFVDGWTAHEQQLSGSF